MISGIGFFLWKIRFAEGGNLDQIVSEARRAGLTHVQIKAADGPWRYNIFEGRDLIPDLVKALRDAGIQVWLWQYVYGFNPGGEALTAIERIRQFMPDGFIVNAEAEYKGRHSAATAYMKALRAGVGDDLLIGLSSYRWPSYHPTFPFKEFLAWCDFVQPQVYWLKADNPRHQLHRTLEEHKQFNKPVFPTGACFREHGWQPTSEQVVEFLNACKEFKLAGCNFWEWANAKQNLPKTWEEVIVPYRWTESPAPKPDPVPDPGPSPADTIQYRVKSKVLNVRRVARASGNIPVRQLKEGDIVTLCGVDGTDAWIDIGPNEKCALRTGGTEYLERVEGK